MESETDGRVDELATPAPASVQMRTAREAAGLTLADVATRTRVPLRHLEALERGDFAALPGVTYCAGFARAYARAVGLDEKALVAKVRQEVDHAGDFTDLYQPDEPADPARVPPRALAWTTAIVAVLLSGGYALWRYQINTPPSASEVIAPSAPAVRPVLPAPAPRPVGPVVLTAVEDVWLRIYDADRKDLFQGMLTKGQSFTVPDSAHNPMILTGRADALAVTVGGRAVPPLGTAERTVSDMPVSAQALLARGTAQTGEAVPAQAVTSPAAQPTKPAPTTPGSSQTSAAQPAASVPPVRSTAAAPAARATAPAKPASDSPRPVAPVPARPPATGTATPATAPAPSSPVPATVSPPGSSGQ